LKSSDIGVSVQAYDADLTSWAAIAPSAKQDALVSGTNIKTVNGNTLLGSGDLVVSGGSSNITIANKTGAYAVVADDNGKIISCSGSQFTVSLTAAATLGSGFHCWIWNSANGSGASSPTTIDPNGSELIDGIHQSVILRNGEGVHLICTGTGWLRGDGRKLKLFAENSAFESASLAYPIAVGRNAMSIGAAYASGDESAAINIATNSSVYGAKAAGAFATGSQATASGTNSVAIGQKAVASSTNSVAISSTGSWSAGPLASGIASTAIGDSPQATDTLAFALGALSKAEAYGKFAYNSGRFTAVGDSQTGMMVLQRAATSETPVVLTSNTGTVGATNNQLYLPPNSAFAFDGIIVARRQAAGGAESAAWKVEGLIRREASAASTTLVASTVTAISNAPGWTLALSADTANSSLSVTFTGAAATNIRAVATLRSSEVTYA
jgi:hypothetical protein